MKTYNKFSIIICLIIICLNLSIDLDTSNLIKVNSNYSSNSGLGHAMVSILRFYGTIIITGILFIISIFIAILNKDLYKPFTILNLAIIILTGALPLLMN